MLKNAVCEPTHVHRSHHSIVNEGQQPVSLPVHRGKVKPSHVRS